MPSSFDDSSKRVTFYACYLVKFTYLHKFLVSRDRAMVSDICILAVLFCDVYLLRGPGMRPREVPSVRLDEVERKQNARRRRVEISRNSDLSPTLNSEHSIDTLNLHHIYHLHIL